MKDIKDMNLAELADRVESDEDIYHDEYVFVERLRELHELTRWIPVSERMPTEKDGSHLGYVLWWRTDSIDLPDAGQWDLYTEYANDPNIAFYTHWQRITPPEGV
jgi:hypothetical protein